MRGFLAALLFCATVVAGIADPFSGVEELAGRRVPWLSPRLSFEPLSDASGDAFELSTQDGRVEIRATNANAAAMGLGWYLKYACHRSMSHVGDNLGPVGGLPALDRPVRMSAWATHRYALNYCTYNYTMSFYSWADWEHELDWMALNGVNLMLVANGEEAVWQNTLRRLGCSDAEIARFLPGPGYTAWWLMGNLEGWGGPMPQAVIERRSALQRQIIARMRSLGIEPLLPGFYGMVPGDFQNKVHARVLDQGKWSSFHRPGLLDPTDPFFPRVAAIYYDELKKLYGPDLHFFSGDPFHEGGDMSGVDLKRAGAAIQAALENAFPGSTWVLQGWLENPRRELLAGTDRSHVLVQELAGESTRNWETRRAYEGTPFLWCCINNYGERPGLFGALQRYADEVDRARHGAEAPFLAGVGIMPEGIANNPPSSDLALELGWRREHVDARQWIDGYVQYRYGKPDKSLTGAWSLLLQTAYASSSGPENVLCARPATPVRPVTTWGSLKIGYDQAMFAQAADLFASAQARFAGVETYRRDLTSLRLQVLSNQALGVAALVDAALVARDKDAFEDAAGRFLGLGRAADELLSRDPSCRLDSYIARALACGATPEEKRICLRDALMLITCWGGDDRSDDLLHDYAFKAWSGLMTSYDLKRWELYFDFKRSAWNHPSNAAPPDFFAWERRWVDAHCRELNR